MSDDNAMDKIQSLAFRAFNRTKSEVNKAAKVSKNRLALRQAKADLDHFWVRLGKTAYQLTQGGEIDHPAIRKAMARILELEQRIDDLTGQPAGEDEQ